MRRLALLALLLPLPGAAATLDLTFLPPPMEPQDLCVAAPDAGEPADPAGAQGEQARENAILLRYLKRDLRDLGDEDPRRWLPFLLDLIDWQARLDPTFTGAAPLLAKVRAFVDAGDLDGLRASGLVDELRASTAALTDGERVTLAQLLLDGVGGEPDVAAAHALLLEAGYGGNVDALLTIARLDLLGAPVPGWEAPLDLTVTLAFGGMLGAMGPGVCDRALRIAREYRSGDLVTPDPEVALAWERWAADLGDGGAAWRVVEFYLGADAARLDAAEMARYLSLAVAHGFELDEAAMERLRALGPAGEAALRDALGPNWPGDAFAEGRGRGRPSLAPLLQLGVNLDAEEVSEDGPYLRYLRALSELPTAPGWVFTRLANEVLVKEGRWAGEAEALALLEEAARRGDGEGMRLLAGLLLRDRDDPAVVERAASLLMEAAEVQGTTEALRDLDALFRCQAPDAPRLAEARPWADAWRDSGLAPVDLGATDLVALDPLREPEALAALQTQALRGVPASLAGMAERVQLDRLATEDGRLLWAGRLQRSDKALELFAELEFTLAPTPAERDLALELFRRVHLNNGVTTALDLAVALVEQDGRRPQVASEVERLLEQASRRGEGAAIRLLARLRGDERGVYEAFAQAIEERGDFLALMFATPFVGPATAADYEDRAVSLMTCGTKDADELGDAATIRGLPDLSDRWRRVGLAVEGGNVLSRLGLTNRQMGNWRLGPAPSRREALERALAEGDGSARRALFDLLADPDLPSFDPEAASGHLLALLGTGDAADEAWALGRLRLADPLVRGPVEAALDLPALLGRAAQAGDAEAQLDLATYLRDTAAGPADLADSLRWLRRAAEAGHPPAMAELGRALALGLGAAPDREEALLWLGRAAEAGDGEAADLARLLGLSP